MKYLDESFQIKNTLDYCNFIFAKHGFYKIFPGVEDELERYSETINKSLKIKGPIDGCQMFGIPIYMMVEGDLYHLHWKIIKPELYNIKPVMISIENDNIHSDPEHVNQEKVAYYSRMDVIPPIIIARHFAIKKSIVIDGNHRLHALKTKGIKQAKAIILDPNQHINYLLSDQMKALYKMHHNLSFLLRIFAEPLSNLRCYSDHSLSLKSYYPLVKSINFRKRNNLLWSVYRLPRWLPNIIENVFGYRQKT
ncbi:hypothetical protein GCM10027422_34150 [Hymenobacter arcticus]